MAIAKNTLANIGGAVIPLATTIFTVPLYLRLIGEERFGVLAVLWVILDYFGFFDFGLGKATLQRMARLNSADERSNLFWTALLLTMVFSAVGGVILWLSAEYLLTHSLRSGGSVQSEAQAAFPWLVIAVPLLLITSLFQSVLQARERFIAINSVGALGNTLNQLLPLLVAWLGYQNMDALLPAALGGRCITSALLFLLCIKHVPLRNNPRIDHAHIRPLLSFGGWSSAISVTGPLLVTLDRLVIGSISGAKAVAYYAVPYNLVTKLLLLPSSLGAALFPQLAALPAAESKDLADHATHIVIAITTPAVVIAMALTHPFLVYWVGANFAERAAGVGELLLLGIWLNGIAHPHFHRLYAMQRLKVILAIYAVEIPIYFLMLWAGLKYLGLAGAAIAWSLRVLIDTILLLSAAAALRKSASYAWPSLLLTMVACGISMQPDIGLMARWSVFVLLAILSLGIHWRILTEAFFKLWSRKKSPLA